MDATRILWLGGLFASTTYLISTYNTSFAFQRPIQTSILTLLTTGIVLLLSSWLQSYSLAQHNDKIKTHASRRRNASFSYQTSRPLSQRRTRVAAVAIVVILCVRVEILRRVNNNSQCSRQSLAALIPIGTTLYEQWTSLVTSETVQTQNPARSWKARLVALLLLPAVLSAGLLSVSSLMAASSYAMPRSSYICAHNGSLGWTIPLLQNIGVLLDGVFLVIVGVLVLRPSEEPGTARSMSLLGWLSVASSLLLFVSGLNPWITPQYRWYMEDFSGIYLAHTMRLITAISFTVLCGLRVLCWIGAARTSSLFTFVFIYISSTTAAWRYRLISSPVSSYANLFYLTLAGIGLSLTLRTHSSNKFPNLQDLMRKTRFGHRSFVALVIFCTIPATLWFTKVLQTTLGHPIETLISNANHEHDEWARQASTSTSLNSAAQNYRARYGRDPPPNFDHWYAYATLHDSLIIDDFDNIYNDILPFWSLAPVKTRQRTLEAIANPWNNIAGIMIRGGTVTVSAGTPATHEWMMSGVAEMIKAFAQWLPDMDLAFNLNDEGRVANPYDSFQTIMHSATSAFRTAPSSTGEGGQTFTPFHLRTWPPIPSPGISTTRFIERSWHPTWSEFGSIVCPPNSPARTHHAWDLSTTNPSYLLPHTYQGYISNYTLSFSPCHQPDLAHLHGLHMSPAAFKGTYDLVPVFSQSKAAGYSDIRYPSAWNYVGREGTVYAPNESHPDPEFREKERTLFWRGGTTEGVSAFETGVWQGMGRQRMVWLFNNAVDNDGVKHIVHLPTKSTSTSPTSSGQAIYTPQLLPPSLLHTHAATNISLHIPLHISRCADSSCATQHAEFRPDQTQPIDFQEHWRFKYLLDMDGAGFSGRFLPFLASGSVVVKMGVVREWWEGRVGAWWDFVPCDVRGHEVGGVVAFLGGWRRDGEGAGVERGGGDVAGGGGEGDGDVKGNEDWVMPPRDDIAERIARQGQQTANTMLRKVDMEIYMFRLLLEWGRVVDDNRELLGWRGNT